MLIFVLNSYPLVFEMIGMLIHRVSPYARVIPIDKLKLLDDLIEKNGEADFIIIDPQASHFWGTLGLEYISENLPHAKIIFITDLDIHADSITDFYSKKNQIILINKKAKVSHIYSELKTILSTESCSHEQDLAKIGVVKISKRHQQIISLLDRGLTNQEIAQQLGISESTVKVHFFRLNKILKTKNRLQVLNFAKLNGWILKV